MRQARRLAGSAWCGWRRRPPGESRCGIPSRRAATRPPRPGCRPGRRPVLRIVTAVANVGRIPWSRPSSGGVTTTTLDPGASSASAARRSDPAGLGPGVRSRTVRPGRAGGEVVGQQAKARAGPGQRVEERSDLLRGGARQRWRHENPAGGTSLAQQRGSHQRQDQRREHAAAEGKEPRLANVRTPTDMTTAIRDGGVDAPVTYTLTRERVRPTNRWRDDPEARIVRDIDVPAAQAVDTEASVRLDARAADATLATLLGIEGPRASVRLTGVPTAAGWAAADGDESTAWITPFGHVDGAVLQAELVDPDAPMSVTQRAGDYSRVTALRLSQGAASADVVLAAPDAEGRSSFTLPDGFEAGPVRDRDHGERAGHHPRPPLRRHRAAAGSDHRDRQRGPHARCRPRSTRGAATTSFRSTGWRSPSACAAASPTPWPARHSTPSAATTPRCASTRARTASPPTPSRGPGCRSTAWCSRPTWSSRPRPAPAAEPTATVTSSDRLHRTVQVDGCPDGLLAGARGGLPRVVVGADRRRLARTSAARRRRIQRLVDPAEQHRHHRAHRAGPHRVRSTSPSPSAWRRW